MHVYMHGRQAVVQGAVAGRVGEELHWSIGSRATMVARTASCLSRCASSGLQASNHRTRLST